MAETITFKGTTIWDGATNGAGYDFTPSALVVNITEAGAPLGTGYWIKQGNTTPATHTLDLNWATTDKAALRSAIEALATATLGSLVLPDWGTFTNCRLSGVGTFDSRKSSSSTGYIVTATLTFTQYP